MKFAIITLIVILKVSTSEASCHCQDGCIQSPKTKCTSCIPGWFGTYCQKQNIAQGQNASQSSIYNSEQFGGPYPAVYAVDGNASQDVNKYSYSCSHTDDPWAWWEVFFGPETYNISQIKIYLRNDNLDRNNGLTVYVGRKRCFTLTDWTQSILDIDCKPTIKGNSVKVTIPGNILTLCEVQVFVCSDGWFGTDCDKQCQCNNTSEVCDKDTGYCKSGCTAGKQGEGCQEDCNDGHYGVNCAEQCGRCNFGDACNKTSGVCENGCKVNYKQPFCRDCFGAFYGTDCQKECGQCKDGTPCDQMNGVCQGGCRSHYEVPYCKDSLSEPSCHCTSDCSQWRNTSCNSCKPNWFGTHCQKYNIALGKNTNQSSTYTDTYYANLAVDGFTYNDFNKNSCTHTYNNRSWWYVTLGQEKYNISEMKIYLRSDNQDRNEDLNVYVDDILCYHLRDYKTSLLNITCDHVLRGNVVKVTVPSQILTLCEVQVFVCSDGWFGYDCDEQCQCSNKSEVCDKSTGYCRSGCTAGKHGEGCRQDCNIGRFGENCNKTCYCKTSICDMKTGYCSDGCLPGKQGEACQEDCSDGFYGDNCTSKCGSCKGGNPCNKTNGVCEDGCGSGFDKPKCQNCSEGYHGPDCKLCGRCKNGNPCNMTDGVCSNGCEKNFETPFCQNCTPGRFGNNCSSHCGHCNSTEACNPFTGHCHHGCTVGYTGLQCLQVQHLGSVPPPSKSNAGLIGGITVTVIVIIAAVAVTVIVLRRRRIRLTGAGKHNDINIGESEFDGISENSQRGKKEVIKSEKRATIKTTKSSNAEFADSRTIKEDPKTPDNVYENSRAYYNILPSPIPVVALGRYIKDKLAAGVFDEEYKLLHYGLQREHTEGKKPENKKRNRFLELFPYDHSRVVLAADGDDKWDYINASYISGFKESRVFIAAQGPNETTVNDLWRMIWQENTTHIVMLTRLMEMTKKKCEQYWPKEDEEKFCGNIKIKVKSTKVRADFTIREVVVKHTQNPSERRVVTQLHFTSWPDHDAPSPPALVGFWKKYRYMRQAGQKNVGPDVVHCSAGVGRTGTFIALDSLFDEAEKMDKVNVFMCVSKMREARMNMVQTASQYRFVHESLLEVIGSKGTFYTLPEFDSKFGTGTSFSRQQEQTMSREFQSLESMRPNFKEEQVSEARRPENMKKNKNKTIVPGNKTRPFLSTAVAGRNSYINAVLIPSATQPLALIVTQTPLPETIVDFWRLVYDHDCFTIVCLDNMEDAYPKKNQSLESGPFRITWCKEDTTCDSFIKTDFTLDLSARADTAQSITVYKPKTPITHDKTSFHQLVNGLDIVNIQDHKLLVHCPDGSRLSGLFCSVLNIITRVKLDKEVDIYLTIRELQCVRPQFIDSYEQYKLCYDMVKEHQRSTTVYANM